MLQITPAVTITTTSGGAATVYIGDQLRGYLVALIYTPGGDSGLDTGADLTVTCNNTGIPILTKVNLGTGTSYLFPAARGTLSDNATGGLGTAPFAQIPLVREKIKVVVAQGGDTKTGTIQAIYDDGVNH